MYNIKRQIKLKLSILEIMIGRRLHQEDSGRIVGKRCTLIYKKNHTRTNQNFDDIVFHQSIRQSLKRKKQLKK